MYMCGWEILIASDCALGFWAGELVCGFRTQNLGLRKLRPRVELQSLWDRARALATEQKRNVQLDLAMTHL